MTEAYLDAQRRRRGSQSEHSQQGELTEKDRAKTYHDQEHGILGCQHYRRGVKLQCSTCNHWATCRYCHDEEEDHKLIRYLPKLSVLPRSWRLQPFQERHPQYALHALLHSSKGGTILPKLSNTSRAILLRQGPVSR